MKISFLVTYYNQEAYVKQSLDSILAAEKPCDWEIVVGDDGSADGTANAVNEYIKRYPDRIRLFVMPREKGREYDPVRRASANRLNLLECSTGDVFCTLDGDDYFCDTRFVKDAVGIFERNEDISVVAFGCRYITNGGCRNERLLPADAADKRLDKKTYLENYYLPAGACVHRKNFGKDRIGYLRNLGYFDDNNIVVNSLNFGEMYVVNRSIYAYRQTGQGVYSGMNDLEQTVLNVQGMDADLRLVDESLSESVRRRYVSAVIQMYVRRKKIRKVLGEETCRRYEDGCRKLMPSFCYDLLNFEEAEECRKKEIKEFLRRNKKNTFKQYLKFCLAGIIQ